MNRIEARIGELTVKLQDTRIGDPSRSYWQGVRVGLIEGLEMALSEIEDQPRYGFGGINPDPVEATLRSAVVEPRASRA